LLKNTEFSVVENQKLNPPQSPLAPARSTPLGTPLLCSDPNAVRGDDDCFDLEGIASNSGFARRLNNEVAPPLMKRLAIRLSYQKTIAKSLVMTRGGREGLGFLPYDPKLTALARINRKNPTPAEQKIWFEILRSCQFFTYKFLRQKPIDRFIVDFYCSALRWVIEIDGDSHAENPAYDINRTQILQGHKLTVTRYTNHDVMHNIDGVYDDMARQIS
jgi:very-short-patch-repair endonuclease